MPTKREPSGASSLIDPTHDYARAKRALQAKDTKPRVQLRAVVAPKFDLALSTLLVVIIMTRLCDILKRYIDWHGQSIHNTDLLTWRDLTFSMCLCVDNTAVDCLPPRGQSGEERQALLLHHNHIINLWIQIEDTCRYRLEGRVSWLVQDKQCHCAPYHWCVMRTSLGSTWDSGLKHRHINRVPQCGTTKNADTFSNISI